MPDLSVDTQAPSKELARGYRFWGLMVAAILLVELAGAVKGSNWYEQHILKHHPDAKIPWTTISGMIGHLEELWPTTAVLVVAVIAPVAFYALAPSAPKARLSRSELGRVYIGQAPTRRVPWYSAWLVFALCALVGLIAVNGFDDDFVRAYCIYGALFTFGIVIPSVLLLFRTEPGFTSLFVTISALRRRSDALARVITIALAAGMGILAIHLAFYPGPTSPRNRSTTPD